MRVAVVGCGQISRQHVRAVQGINGLEIEAVCDRDQDRVREIASLVKGATVYGDLANLLERERPDVVHILTPPETHPLSFD